MPTPTLLDPDEVPVDVLAKAARAGQRAVDLSGLEGVLEMRFHALPEDGWRMSMGAMRMREGDRLIHPAVFCGIEAVRRLDHDELTAVLLHEIAHLRPFLAGPLGTEPSLGPDAGPAARRTEMDCDRQAVTWMGGDPRPLARALFRITAAVDGTLLAGPSESHPAFSDRILALCALLRDTEPPEVDGLSA